SQKPNASHSGGDYDAEEPTIKLLEQHRIRSPPIECGTGSSSGAQLGEGPRPLVIHPGARAQPQHQDESRNDEHAPRWRAVPEPREASALRSIPALRVRVGPCRCVRHSNVILPDWARLPRFRNDRLVPINPERFQGRGSDSRFSDSTSQTTSSRHLRFPISNCQLEIGNWQSSSLVLK